MPTARSMQQSSNDFNRMPRVTPQKSTEPSSSIATAPKPVSLEIILTKPPLKMNGTYIFDLCLSRCQLNQALEIRSSNPIYRHCMHRSEKVNPIKRTGPKNRVKMHSWTKVRIVMGVEKIGQIQKWADLQVATAKTLSVYEKFLIQ